MAFVLAAPSIVLGVVYLLALLPQAPQGLVLAPIAGDLGAVAAVLIGVRRYRPSYRLPWFLIAGGLACHLSAAVVYAVVYALGRQVPSPGPPDALFLCAYLLFAAAPLLWMLRRGTARDLTAWIDVAIIGVAAGTLSWLFLIVPAYSDAGVVVAAFACADLLLLGAGLRMVFGVRQAGPALALLGAGFSCLLVGDTLTAIAITHLALSSTATAALGAFFVVAVPLIGAAALHPSMVGLHQRVAAGADTGRSERRLPLLGGSLLVAPLAMAAGHGDGQDQYINLYAAVSVLLSILVMTRMWLLMRSLRRLAITDGLSGLRTRRFFEESLAPAVARHLRSGEPISVLLLDVDHFKRINDTYGHGAGDAVLREIADRLRGTARASDVVARYGGEEFAVLLSGATPANASTAAERLRTAIAAPPISVGEDQSLDVTVSIGVAGLPGATPSGAELMLQADHALYAAKEQGRNRVVVSGSSRVERVGT